MGFNSNTINFKAGLDTSGVATGVQKIKGNMSGLSKSVNKIKRSFGGLGAAIAGAFAINRITAFARSSILLAEQTATAQARIDQIARSMGVFGEKTTEVASRIKKYAEENEILLATDRNVIMMTQAKLLTFKELAKTANVIGSSFDRATKASIDMAAAGFGEATMNAVQLGKALNDPIVGITSLTRSGITFTAQEKEKIKVLVESNKILVAQDMILESIETQVGGTAEATADATTKIGLYYQSLQRSIGTMLLPTVEKLAKKLEHVQRLGLATALHTPIEDVEQFESDAKADAARIKKRIADKNLSEQYAAIQKELTHAQKEQQAFVHEDIKATRHRTIYYGKLVALLKEMNDEFIK